MAPQNNKTSSFIEEELTENIQDESPTPLTSELSCLQDGGQTSADNELKPDITELFNIELDKNIKLLQMQRKNAYILKELKIRKAKTNIKQIYKIE